jgi:hypothetical protein
LGQVADFLISKGASGNAIPVLIGGGNSQRSHVICQTQNKNWGAPTRFQIRDPNAQITINQGSSSYLKYKLVNYKAIKLPIPSISKLQLTYYQANLQKAGIQEARHSHAITRH